MRACLRLACKGRRTSESLANLPSNMCRAVDELMKDLPLKKLRNFGGKLGAELGEMNCTTAGQVAALPHKALVDRFGERATGIARAVRGYSDEPVQARRLCPYI